MVFHTKIVWKYTFCRSFVSIMFKLGSILLVCGHQMLDGSHHTSVIGQPVTTCHLGDARISTLLDPVRSLNFFSAYRICHIYIFISGWACVCVCEGERRCVWEKVKEAFAAFSDPDRSVFLVFFLITVWYTKLLPEQVAAHFASVTKFEDQQLQNAHWREQYVSWERYADREHNAPQFHNPIRQIDR